MNEKSIPIIKTKITLVTKNNYKHAEKKYCLVMTKIHNMSIIFAAVGLKLACGAILLS